MGTGSIKKGDRRNLNHMKQFASKILQAMDRKRERFSVEGGGVDYIAKQIL